MPENNPSPRVQKSNELQTANHFSKNHNFIDLNFFGRVFGIVRNDLNPRRLSGAEQL
jgi:hypothetical protein